MPRRSTTALLLLAFAFGACGDDGNLIAQAGSFRIGASISPDPPRVGQHTLRIEIKGVNAQPIEGASIGVDPQMPTHGHGSTETAKVSEKERGIYEAFPITFQMPGFWEISVTADSKDETGWATFGYDVR